MAFTKLLLVTGDRIEVHGSIEDVSRLLQDAARSGSGTLAWLEEPDSREPLGVSPAHVVTLIAAET